MCSGVVVRKFRNLTFFSLFVQASGSQEETQESITPHLLKLVPFVLILSLVVSFGLDLKPNYAFESISRLLRAHRPPCILHRFYKTPPHVMCVHC